MEKQNIRISRIQTDVLISLRCEFFSGTRAGTRIQHNVDKLNEMNKYTCVCKTLTQKPVSNANSLKKIRICKRFSGLLQHRITPQQYRWLCLSNFTNFTIVTISISTSEMTKHSSHKNKLVIPTCGFQRRFPQCNLHKCYRSSSYIPLYLFPSPISLWFLSVAGLISQLFQIPTSHLHYLIFHGAPNKTFRWIIIDWIRNERNAERNQRQKWRGNLRN